jgi:hypothetical protein
MSRPISADESLEEPMPLLIAMLVFAVIAIVFAQLLVGSASKVTDVTREHSSQWKVGDVHRLHSPAPAKSQRCRSPSSRRCSQRRQRRDDRRL